MEAKVSENVENITKAHEKFTFYQELLCVLIENKTLKAR